MFILYLQHKIGLLEIQSSTASRTNPVQKRQEMIQIRWCQCCGYIFDMSAKLCSVR